MPMYETLKEKIRLLSLDTLLFLFAVVMISCNAEVHEQGIEDISFSTAYYYPSFLFSKSRNDIVTKKIRFEFNEFAGQSSITMGLFDKDGRLMNDFGIKLYIDNIEIDNGWFQLNAQDLSEGELQISILYPSNTKTQRYTGYVKVIEGDIDRVNHVDVLTGNPVFSWSGTHVVSMNPLKKWLIVMFTVLVGILITWLVVLKPIVYNRFRRVSLTINSPFFKRIKIKGAVSLTLTDKKQKQSFWSKLFKGKDLVYVHPFFTNPVIIMPKSKADVRIRIGANYTLNPFTTYLSLNKSYDLINNQTGEKITIS